MATASNVFDSFRTTMSKVVVYLEDAEVTMERSDYDADKWILIVDSDKPFDGATPRV